MWWRPREGEAGGGGGGQRVGEWEKSAGTHLFGQLHLRAQYSSPLYREAFCILPNPPSTELCVLPWPLGHLHLSISSPALWLVWLIPSSGLRPPSGLGQCLYIFENREPSVFSGTERHSINNDGRRERRNNKWIKDWKRRQEERVGGQEGGMKQELDMQIFLDTWSFLRLGAFSYSILYLQPLPQNNNL